MQHLIPSANHGMFTSHAPVPIPNMAQPPLSAQNLAQRHPALRVLQHISAGAYAPKQVWGIRDTF
jgi:hypothetical protein